MSTEDTVYVPISTLAKKLSCNTNTVRRWVRQGILPDSVYLKVGSFYRFNVEAAIEALKSSEEPKTYVDEVTGLSPEETSDIAYNITNFKKDEEDEEDEEDFVDFDVDEDL